jgi:hypothetical protein
LGVSVFGELELAAFCQPSPRLGICDVGQLLKQERHIWRERHLLAPRALRDFSKLTDECFRLRRKNFSQADLVAELNRASRDARSRNRRAR